MGAELALAARFVLAGALAFAAIAKAIAGSDSREQFARLLPTRIARPVAVALPFVELAVAVALVAFWASTWPAVVALALLLAFTIVLVRAQLARVPCPCFGAATATARPVDARAILRNGVLLALAVLATGDAHDAGASGTAAAGVLLGALTALAVRAAR